MNRRRKFLILPGQQTVLGLLFHVFHKLRNTTLNPEAAPGYKPQDNHQKGNHRKQN